MGFFFSGFRNVRRKSVLSPRMLKPPGEDIENSPANSITSVNSIASLLKEKLQVMWNNYQKPYEILPKCFYKILCMGGDIIFMTMIVAV